MIFKGAGYVCLWLVTRLIALVNNSLSDILSLLCNTIFSRGSDETEIPSSLSSAIVRLTALFFFLTGLS